MTSRPTAFRTHSSPIHTGSPLAILASLALLGTATAAWLPPAPVAWAVAMVPATLLLAWWLPRPWRCPLQWLAVGIGWWAWGLLAFHPVHPHAVIRQMERPRESVIAEGWVRAHPVQLQSRQGSTGRWRLAVQPTRWKRLPAWQPVRGQLTVWTDAPVVATLAVGDRVRLSGVVTPGRRPGAGLQPSVASMEVGETAIIPLGGHDGPWLLRAADRWREACAGILSRGLDDHPHQRAVWLALLLGYRHDVPEPLQALFSETGTFHLFAISGLHVGIVAVALSFLAQVIRIPASRRPWLVLPGLFLFAACTGFRASTVRAVIMAVVWFMAPAARRRPHGLSAWSAAVVLVLSWAPTQIADLGFQFSFGIVFGLLLLYRPVTRPWMDRLSRDPWRVGDESAISRAARAVGRYVVGLAGVSLCAWVISAPLMAGHFGRLAPGGLLANLAVVPLAFVAVSAGMLSLLTAWWAPLSEASNHAGLWAVEGMLVTVRAVASIPAATWRISPPPLALVLGWYAWWAICGWTRRTGALAWMILLGIVGTTTWVEHHRRGQVQVHVFDQGGAATVLLQHRGASVLVDPGPARSWPRLERRLDRAGVEEVDVLVLTTGLAGQIGAVPDLLDALTVHHIWFPAAEPLPRGFSAARNAAHAADIPVRYCGRGQEGEMVPGLWAEVLHPDPGTGGGAAGDTAMILRLSQGPNAILLEGAANGVAQRSVLRAPLDLPAGWWVVSTSNDRDAVPEAWARNLWPEEVLLSRSAEASFYGPRDRRLQRLEGGGRWWRLSETGPLTGVLGGELEPVE